MNDLLYLLTGKPYPLPGEGSHCKGPRVYDSRAEQFSAAQAAQRALHRNRRVANRNRVLDAVVQSKKGGVFAEDIAASLGIGSAYVRRLLKELANEGLVFGDRSGASAVDHTRWRAKNAMPDMRVERQPCIGNAGRFAAS